MKQRIERWTFKPVKTQKPLEFGGLTHPLCAETTKATTAWSGPGITKNVEEMARHTANHAVDSGDIYIYSEYMSIVPVLWLELVSEAMGTRGMQC